MAKKELKENQKKKVEKKKTPKVKKESYMAGVTSELKKVKWPSKNEVIKYTIATIMLVLVLVVFFILLDLGMSIIKGAFN